MTLHRRQFLKTTASASVGLSGLGLHGPSIDCKASIRSDDSSLTQDRESIPGVKRLPESIEICSPRDRVPLTFIIDDSTCLVNMATFAMPQFAEAWPNRDEYRHPWKQWPREIPDRFVREFGEWCAEHGVKGKYSIVPNPACVGWLDRELPGWSRRELRDSLKLVRELMLPNWDIHPELITHTRVIDLNTGRPIEPATAASMENSFPQSKISVDELTSYLAYALRILQRCELPCEGITTPGGFGNAVKSELSIAVREAVSDVFQVEIPHYFKYVMTGKDSTSPRIEHANFQGNRKELTMNIPAGTGDWFGGWHGVRSVEPDRYADEDATSGRMVELIERGEPAFMLCHWPGLYNNGTKQGFYAFQRIVKAIDGRFRHLTHWLKLSEIARYWAVKETIDITFDKENGSVIMNSPFACEDFTIKHHSPKKIQSVGINMQDLRKVFKRVDRREELVSGTYITNESEVIACCQLPAGKSILWLK